MLPHRCSITTSSPIAVVILIGLFFFQSRGTAGVGAVFGPITLIWFVAISLLGFQSYHSRASSACRHQSHPRVRIFHDQWLARFRGARRRVSGRYRWRSALRRYRTFWNGAHSPDLVCSCPSGPNAELFRAGSAFACSNRMLRLIPFTEWRRSGRFIHWWCSRRLQRLLPRKRSLAARFRLPCRPSSSATARV